MKKFTYTATAILALSMATQAFGNSTADVQQNDVRNYEYTYLFVGDYPAESSSGIEEIRREEKYCFAEEIQVGGKEYMPFVNMDDGHVAALIRVDNRKAYILITPEFLEENTPEPIEGYIGYTPQVGEELLIWDFETPVGSTYVGLTQTNNLTQYPSMCVTQTITIDSEESVESNGNSFQARTLSGEESDICPSAQIIEGLGPLEGYLFAPFLGPLCDCPYFSVVFLRMVKDRSTDTVIYGKPPAIESVSIPVDHTSDGRMYDLMGREIRNPLPGTIYIRNGEKHIAR